MIEKNNRETTVDEDIARMRKDFLIGRFTSDFDGMDTMTLMKRVGDIRRKLYQERVRLPQNANRPISDVYLETDREDFFPNVHFICEKMIASSADRFKAAESALTSALNSSNVRPGKKAMQMRRAIDAKYEAAVSNRLSEERKKIDAQKREMEKYIKMAPDSSYAAVITDILKQNEESYRLYSQCLSMQSIVEKYESYEKRGVIVEDEKKLCILAKEANQAAELWLTNHKQSSYIIQERDALLKFDNKALMKEAHEKSLSCEKNSFAFIEIPKELTERLLEHGLAESERKYYDALQAKQNLVGFHPFKKMALNREIKKTAKEYNDGLALLPDTRENRLKHPPLTTLEEWKKQNSFPEEKVIEDYDDLVGEFPIELIEEEPEKKKIIQLDLSDKLRTAKQPQSLEMEQVPEKQKTTPELDIEP